MMEVLIYNSLQNLSLQRAIPLHPPSLPSVHLVSQIIHIRSSISLFRYLFYALRQRAIMAVTFDIRCNPVCVCSSRENGSRLADFFLGSGHFVVHTGKAEASRATINSVAPRERKREKAAHSEAHFSPDWKMG